MVSTAQLLTQLSPVGAENVTSAMSDAESLVAASTRKVCEPVAFLLKKSVVPLMYSHWSETGSLTVYVGFDGVVVSTLTVVVRTELFPTWSVPASVKR